MRRMYFVGVTTARSSMQRIFPRWTRLAGLDDATLAGIDLPIGASPDQYRAAVETIRTDSACWGALVTSHKIGIYDHARDLLAGFDADAEKLGEVSCMVRRGGKLMGRALDPPTAATALRAIVVAPFRGSVLILGAGGAALALATVLAREHLPREVILTDISADRLQWAKRLSPARCELTSMVEESDRLLATMPPGSLIVNATGMGKDRPGSPVSAGAVFPKHAIAWDLNYRGNLLFLEYARAQGIRAVDGWEYFLQGWSQSLSNVFSFDLTPPLFAAMREAAEAGR